MTRHLKSEVSAYSYLSFTMQWKIPARSSILAAYAHPGTTPAVSSTLVGMIFDISFNRARSIHRQIQRPSPA